MSWLAKHTDEENCYFTSTGRRSGNPHEVEIWFGVIDDTLYLISGNSDPTIGLTFDAWCFDVPALAIESWSVAGE